MLSNPRRDATEAVTWGVRVASAWIWRLLLIGFGVYVFVRIFFKIELVGFSVVVALFLTSVLHPLEKRLRSAIPRFRSLPAAITLLLGIACLGGIAYFVAWQIAVHSSQLGDQLSTVVQNIKNWLHNGPLHLKSAEIDNLAGKLTKSIQSNQSRLVSGAVETVRTLADGLAAILLVLLSTFFLLRDGDAIWGWVVRLFPREAQRRLDSAGHVGWHVLGGYMRGQVLIALFHGISVMIVLFVLRVPLAAALGVLIFLGSFVPLIGLTVTGALCVAVALLEHGVTAALVVAIAIIVLVQVESHLLQPLIMSRTVEVHPLAIVLAVITGAKLGGIVGALLAVPLVAFLNSTIRALRRPPDAPEDVSGFPLEVNATRDDTADEASGDGARPRAAEPASEPVGAEGRSPS
jgi:predicted PurR-regulated permease PerM